MSSRKRSRSAAEGQQLSLQSAIRDDHGASESFIAAIVDLVTAVAQRERASQIQARRDGGSIREKTKSIVERWVRDLQQGGMGGGIGALKFAAQKRRFAAPAGGAKRLAHQRELKFVKRYTAAMEKLLLSGKARAPSRSGEISVYDRLMHSKRLCVPRTRAEATKLRAVSSFTVPALDRQLQMGEGETQRDGRHNAFTVKSMIAARKTRLLANVSARAMPNVASAFGSYNGTTMDTPACTTTNIHRLQLDECDQAAHRAKVNRARVEAASAGQPWGLTHHHDGGTNPAMGSFTGYGVEYVEGVASAENSAPRLNRRRFARAEKEEKKKSHTSGAAGPFALFIKSRSSVSGGSGVGALAARSKEASSAWWGLSHDERHEWTIKSEQAQRAAQLEATKEEERAASHQRQRVAEMDSRYAARPGFELYAQEELMGKQLEHPIKPMHELHADLYDDFIRTEPLVANDFFDVEEFSAGGSSASDPPRSAPIMPRSEEYRHNQPLHVMRFRKAAAAFSAAAAAAAGGAAQRQQYRETLDQFNNGWKGIGAQKTGGGERRAELDAVRAAQ